MVGNMKIGFNINGYESNIPVYNTNSQQPVLKSAEIQAANNINANWNSGENAVINSAPADAQIYCEITELMKKVILSEDFIKLNINQNTDLKAAYEEFIKSLSADGKSIEEFIKFSASDNTKFTGEFFDKLNELLNSNSNITVKNAAHDFLEALDCYFTRDADIDGLINAYLRMANNSSSADRRNFLLDLLYGLDTNNIDKITEKLEALIKILSGELSSKNFEFTFSSLLNKTGMLFEFIAKAAEKNINLPNITKLMNEIADLIKNTDKSGLPKQLSEKAEFIFKQIKTIINAKDPLIQSNNKVLPDIFENNNQEAIPRKNTTVEDLKHFLKNIVEDSQAKKINSEPEKTNEVYKNIKQSDSKPEKTNDVYKSIEQRDSRPEITNEVYKSIEQRDSRPEKTNEVYKNIEQRDSRPEKTNEVYKSIEQRDSKPEKTNEAYKNIEQRDIENKFSVNHEKINSEKANFSEISLKELLSALESADSVTDIAESVKNIIIPEQYHLIPENTENILDEISKVITKFLESEIKDIIYGDFSENTLKKDAAAELIEKTVLPFILSEGIHEEKNLASFLIHNLMRIKKGTEQSVLEKTEFLFEKLNNLPEVNIKDEMLMKLELLKMLKAYGSTANTRLQHILKLLTEGIEHSLNSSNSKIFENMLMTMLSNNSVNSPYKYIFLPFSYNEIYVLSEIWISEKNDEGKREKSKKRRNKKEPLKIFVTFETETEGYFESLLMQSDGVVNLELLLPDKYSEYQDIIADNMKAILEKHNLLPGSISITNVPGPRSPDEVFSKPLPNGEPAMS